MVEYSRPFRQVLDDNSTATAFTAKIPTVTEPTGDGVIDFDDGYRSGQQVPANVIVLPYGSDAADETFAMRVWGWVPDDSGSRLWVPQLLVDLACTLGNISFAVKGTNHFLCDTLVETVDVSGTTIHTTTDLAAAYAEIPTKGCFKLEFDFDSTGAAAMNCLYRLQ